jgi:hypothetical protein
MPRRSPGRVLAEHDAELLPIAGAVLEPDLLKPFLQRAERVAELERDVGSGRGVVVRILAEVDLCTVLALEPQGGGWRPRGQLHRPVAEEVGEEGGLGVRSIDRNAEVDVVKAQHKAMVPAGGDPATG